MQVPPEGEMYVRDPAAARADAIRQKVALYTRHGIPIPEHLQAMFDELPPAGDSSEVELVDAVTGEHVAEVDVNKSPPKSLKKETEAPVVEAPVVAVAPEETTIASSGDLHVDVAVEPEPAPEVKPEPEPVVDIAPPASPKLPPQPDPPKFVTPGPPPRRPPGRPKKVAPTKG